MTTATAILCLLLGALFARPLLSLLRWGVALAVLVGALKGLWLLLPELRNVDWPSIGLGALGATAAGLVLFRFIYNLLVNRDRASDHTGIDKKHDARLI